MISISTPNPSSYHLEKLQKLFLLEWGAVDPLLGIHPNFVIPPPLVALDDQDKLVGGLSFTSFAKPGEKALAVWINAVLVVPEYRRAGVALQLIREAQVKASQLNIIELFVQTDIADLYQRLGWVVVDNNAPNFVLVKMLVKH